MLVRQVIALGWFRCLMEEGYDFINKHTGEVETSEVAVYRNLQQNTGAFDMPSAKCSPRGLEKNLLEVAGSLLVHNENPQVSEALNSQAFKDGVRKHLERIKAREFSGKAPFNRG
jgi:hypothetical protein